MRSSLASHHGVPCCFVRSPVAGRLVACFCHMRKVQCSPSLTGVQYQCGRSATPGSCSSSLLLCMCKKLFASVPFFFGSPRLCRLSMPQAARAHTVPWLPPSSHGHDSWAVPLMCCARRFCLSASAGLCEVIWLRSAPKSVPHRSPVAHMYVGTEDLVMQAQLSKPPFVSPQHGCKHST